jgi:hypothetical protein
MFTDHKTDLSVFTSRVKNVRADGVETCDIRHPHVKIITFPAVVNTLPFLHKNL